MKAMSHPGPSERFIQDAIRSALRRNGWTLAEKTHGNAFQAGWPDLYCFHPVKGHRWVEVKTPKGRLTRAQRVRFAEWSAAGEGIWVLSSVEQIRVLDSPANWTEWA